MGQTRDGTSVRWHMMIAEFVRYTFLGERTILKAVSYEGTIYEVDDIEILEPEDVEGKLESQPVVKPQRLPIGEASILIETVTRSTSIMIVSLAMLAICVISFLFLA